MSGPRTGVRVIDAAVVMAAPFGAALMGDFGAEVIKVEMPGSGDSSRGMGPFCEGQSEGDGDGVIGAASGGARGDERGLGGRPVREPVDGEG